MRRTLLVGLGLLVVLAAAAAVAWRMLPFTTTHLLQELLRGSLPDGAVTVLCRAPLRLPSTLPVPGLLTLVVDGDSAPPTLRRGGLTATRTDRGPWGATYALPPGEDPLAWARDIPDSEPVWERVISGGATPDDPGLPSQWHLQTLGLEKVRAHDATGEGVIVAVIDTGVTAGDDGPLEILRGVDVLEGSSTTEDLNVHGSVVAALIAQTTNNHRGYASLAPDVKILPIRACDARGSCRSDHIAEGIYDAVDQGAQVINLSVSGRISSDEEASAIRYAVQKGRVVVAAAGNEAGTVGWPASIPDVIAVGALSRQGGVARYSNRGWGLDFWAPGGDCVEPVRQEVAHGDELAWGTSVAAPLVSASIAVGIGAGMRPAEVLRRLERTRLEIAGERGGVIRPWMLWSSDPQRPKPTGSGRGMTWALISHDTSHGLAMVGCNHCNPYKGDTQCTDALPVLCLKRDGSEVPPRITMFDYYHGWAAGRIRVTQPIQGTELTSAGVADSICMSAFGAEWRMAGHHDGGGYWAGGGWNWSAYADDELDFDRAWTKIADQRGNCWN